VECETRIDRTPFELDSQAKTAVFRVLQENLTNVARHSGASKAWVSLVVRDDALELTVRDNGAGFDPDSLPANRSFGIAGMKERCSYLGGSFEIFPAPSGGTMGIVRLPYTVSGEDADA